MSEPSEPKGARDWQERMFPPSGGVPIMLPEICLWLRAGVNGSSDPWPGDRVRETLNMLKERLERWAPSVSERERRMDDAVKELVAATIAEVEGYDDWWQDL